MTLSIKGLSVALSITTLRIERYFAVYRIFYCYTECEYAEWHCEDCHYTELRFAEYQCTECVSVIVLNVDMLNVIMLNDIMLIVIVLNVVLLSANVLNV
jgi:hypothetical protein